MHVVFYESNSLDPRKDIYSIDNNVGELLEINPQEENASKFLEFEEPSKKDIEDKLQPSLKMIFKWIGNLRKLIHKNLS